MKIPARFTKTAAAFDAAARWKPCESSGSEHSADLDHLVNSFLEGGIEGDETIDSAPPEDEELGLQSRNLESVDLLKLKSLLYSECDREIIGAVEKARGELLGETALPEFKRLLMARLRRLGLDAGLCKSKWGKNGRRPPGSYEYIDVNSGGTRYIVEVGLACEFTIARPTPKYSSLLEMFPQVYIAKHANMKKLVSTMCSAMKASMKVSGISIPPWRRVEYMQTKWFGTYRRTTNEVSGFVPEESSGKLRVTFAAVNWSSFNCSKDAGDGGAGEDGFRKLTAAS